MQSLGQQKDKDKPELYYEAVPVRFYEQYKIKHKFKDLVITDDKNKKPVPIKDPEPRIINVDSKKEGNGTTPKERSPSLTSGPRLAYPNDTPTYVYRSPGRKNS